MVISVKPWIELGGADRAAAIRDGRLRGIELLQSDGFFDAADSERASPFELDEGNGTEFAPSPIHRAVRPSASGDLSDLPDGVELTPDDRSAEPGDCFHRPVMMEEVLERLQPAEGKRFFDGTLGGGGHSEALLRAGASVIACDQDLDAIAYASERLAEFGDRFRAVQGNFSEMDRILADAGIETVDGILLDLGVSSHQLDAGERGFSFMRPGPLDMRMNALGAETAADLVNYSDPVELIKIFQEYGEEPAARRIVQAIVEARDKVMITTTAALAEIVESVRPRRSGKHPATKVFQALRIAVNDELIRLEEALAKSAGCLNLGGVLAVISFHSLEDRIVKRFFRRHSEKTIDRPEWPAAKPNPDRFYELAMKKPVTPGPYELETNPRSRSAKLRSGVRI